MRYLLRWARQSHHERHIDCGKLSDDSYPPIAYNIVFVLRLAGILILASARPTLNQVYAEPRSDVSLIVGKRYRDQLVVLYYALNAPDGPAYNPVWYRVWGGYVHSAYLQLVEMHFNPVLDKIVEGGQLCEVTVPYSDSYRHDRYHGWQEQYRLYYETTHWVTGIEEGPDGEPWYQITNELDTYLKYYAPAVHLRPIPDEEISPLSPDVPAED